MGACEFREVYMRGNLKCRILKEIRKWIAKENEIPYEFSECEYKGNCSGNCPKCMSELLWLREKLDERESLGKPVTVTAGNLEDFVEYAFDEIDIDSRQSQEDPEELTGSIIVPGPFPEIDPSLFHL